MLVRDVGLDLRRSLMERTKKLRLIRPNTATPATRALVTVSSGEEGLLDEAYQRNRRLSIIVFFSLKFLVPNYTLSIELLCCLSRQCWNRCHTTIPRTQCGLQTWQLQQCSTQYPVPSTHKFSHIQAHCHSDYILPKPIKHSQTHSI